MNPRTRLLAFAVLGLAGLIIVGFLIKGVLVRPLRAIDDQIVQLRVKLNGLEQERRAFLAADSEVRAGAARMFGADADEAEARLGAILTAQIVAVNLREADFTRMPSGRRRLPGAEEIGWTIQGEGPLPRVLDLLFVLQQDPRLHRLESLALSPANEGGRVRVRFRYLSLVLKPAPDFKPVTDLAQANLDSPQRHRYDAIMRRDLLRPMLAGDHEPPPAASEPVQQANVDAQNLKVVSLSSWENQPEAHLYDGRNQKTTVCHPGEKLLDGELAMVDYRPLPWPGKPGLLSYSRLIWRIGEEYWAVEIGQTLAERRRLSAAELPPSLKPNLQTSLSP